MNPLFAGYAPAPPGAYDPNSQPYDSSGAPSPAYAAQQAAQQVNPGLVINAPAPPGGRGAVLAPTRGITTPRPPGAATGPYPPPTAGDPSGGPGDGAIPSGLVSAPASPDGGGGNGAGGTGHRQNFWKRPGVLGGNHLQNLLWGLAFAMNPRGTAETAGAYMQGQHSAQDRALHQAQVQQQMEQQRLDREARRQSLDETARYHQGLLDDAKARLEQSQAETEQRDQEALTTADARKVAAEEAARQRHTDALGRLVTGILNTKGAEAAGPLAIQYAHEAGIPLPKDVSPEAVVPAMTEPVQNALGLGAELHGGGPYGPAAMSDLATAMEQGYAALPEANPLTGPPEPGSNAAHRATADVTGASRAADTHALVGPKIAGMQVSAAARARNAQTAERNAATNAARQAAQAGIGQQNANTNRGRLTIAGQNANAATARANQGAVRVGGEYGVPPVAIAPPSPWGDTSPLKPLVPTPRKAGKGVTQSSRIERGAHASGMDPVGFKTYHGLGFSAGPQMPTSVDYWTNWRAHPENKGLFTVAPTGQVWINRSNPRYAAFIEDQRKYAGSDAAALGDMAAPVHGSARTGTRIYVGE